MATSHLGLGKASVTKEAGASGTIDFVHFEYVKSPGEPGQAAAPMRNCGLRRARDLTSTSPYLVFTNDRQ